MKRTKTKLVSSIVTLLVCFAMLVGSTFAWFTDSASTGVNKIQAGNLDVALEMKDTSGNWVNAEGKTLQFKKAAGAAENEPVLWEPGCTYELPELRIVNKGNLSLKYKIEVTGVTSVNGETNNNKLLEVIEFTYGEGISLGTDVILSPNLYTDGFIIKGHMKEEAGNEYKGLSINGISITVYATQVEGEYDSFDQNYDSNADYIYRTATIMSETDGKTLTLESGHNYIIGDAQVDVDNNGDIKYTNNGSTQTVSITTDGGTLTIDAPNDTVLHYGQAQVVYISGVADNSYHEFGQVGIVAIQKGRVVMENGSNASITQVLGNNVVVSVPKNVVLSTRLQKSSEVNDVQVQKGTDPIIKIAPDGIATDTATQETVNNAVPEELVKVINETPAPVEEVKQYDVMIGSSAYESLQEAVNAATESEEIILLKDIELSGNGVIIGNDRKISINGNGRKISFEHTAFNNFEGLEGLKSGSLSIKSANFSSGNNGYVACLGFNTTEKIVLENCTFNNMYTAVYSNPRTEILDNKASITIKNCVYNNTEWGYGIDDITEGAINASKWMDIVFVNNTGLDNGHEREYYPGAYEAQSGSTYYVSLEEAVADANNNDLITILKDGLELNPNGKTIKINVADNVHSLSLNSSKSSSVTVTGVANADFIVSGSVKATFDENSKVTGNISLSDKTYGKFYGILNGKISAKSTLSKLYPYLYIYDGASINANAGTAIEMDTGWLYANGGTITGNIGLYIKGYAAYFKGTNIVANENAIIVEKTTLPMSTVSIKKGSFSVSPDSTDIIVSRAVEGQTAKTGIISGGQFSIKPDSSCIQDSYKAVKEADEYYHIYECGETHFNSNGICEACGHAFPTAAGQGTSDDPYVISSRQEFLNINKENNKYYILNSDIELLSEDFNNAVINSFQGTLDGNNHKIVINAEKNGSYNYLFKYLYSTVKNLHVVGNGSRFSIALNATRAKFDNVDIYGEYEVTGNESPYIVYCNSGATFTDCDSFATIFGSGDETNYNAIFVGYPYGSTFNFTNCTNQGSIVCGKAAMFIGNGSYDKVTLNIDNCKNYGIIQSAFVTSNINSYFINYFRAVTNDGKGGSLINVSVNGVSYSGNDKSEHALNGDNVERVISGDNGMLINGPQDATLSLSKNSDGTFTITPASAQGVARYEVSVGIYATLKEGGSCREYIKENISADGSETYITTIKDLPFVDEKWVSENSAAVQDTLNGYVVYKLENKTYYYLTDPVGNTVNGTPKNLTLFGVTAYDASGKLLASAGLAQ